MSAYPLLLRATLLLSLVGVLTTAATLSEFRCQAYLCKYGYLNPLNCSCAPEVSNTSCLALRSNAPVKEPCPPKCNDRQYKLALGVFQRTFLPPASLLCDPPTLAAMMVARCGETDDFPPLDDVSAAVQTSQPPTPPLLSTMGPPSTSQQQGLPGMTTQPISAVRQLREASGRIRSIPTSAAAAATTAAPVTTTVYAPSPSATVTSRTVTPGRPTTSRSSPCTSTSKAAAKAAAKAAKASKKVAKVKRSAADDELAAALTNRPMTAQIYDSVDAAASSALPSTSRNSPSTPNFPRNTEAPLLREAPGRPNRRHGIGDRLRGFRGSAAVPFGWSQVGAAAIVAAAPRGRADAAEAASSSAARRRRRSTPLTTSGNATFAGRRSLRWRVLPGYYYPLLSAAEQEAALEQALRKWAAVVPLCFVKDTQSSVNTVDILVAFATGDHLSDGRPFDGPGGDISHSYPGKYTHFDAAESWYVGAAGSATGFQLTAAALHEFGHVLGLKHSQSAKDVMFSLYSDKTTLSPADRDAAMGLYGRCSGPLDAIVDVTYTQTEIDDYGNIVTARLYSTVIFRGDKNWLYKNTDRSPPDGEPQPIWATWSGIPNSVDAVVQYSSNADGGDVVDLLFIFKGSDYYIFDYVTGSVTSSGSISSLFKAGPAGQPIPNNIESAYFDWRDQNIYFFKASKVYAYRYNHRTTNHSCCLFIRNVSDVYPLASQQQAASPPTADAATYQRSIDAVYLQRSTSTLYFFVGDRVWISSPANPTAAAAAASATIVVAAGSETTGYILPPPPVSGAARGPAPPGAPLAVGIVAGGASLGAVINANLTTGAAVLGSSTLTPVSTSLSANLKAIATASGGGSSDRSTTITINNASPAGGTGAAAQARTSMTTAAAVGQTSATDGLSSYLTGSSRSASRLAQDLIGASVNAAVAGAGNSGIPPTPVPVAASAASNSPLDGVGSGRSTLSTTYVVPTATTRSVAATTSAVPSTQRASAATTITPTSAAAISGASSAGGNGGGSNGGGGGRSGVYVTRYYGFWNELWNYICQIDC